MKKCSIILIYILLFHTLLVADDIYNRLGISSTKNKISSTHDIKKIDKIKKCKLKKIYKDGISTLLKHLKSEKVSENKRHYGVGVDYKVSKKVQLSIDILAELDMKKPSRMIKEKQANIRLAIFL